MMPRPDRSLGEVNKVTERSILPRPKEQSDKVNFDQEKTIVRAEPEAEIRLEPWLR